MCVRLLRQCRKLPHGRSKCIPCSRTRALYTCPASPSMWCVLFEVSLAHQRVHTATALSTASAMTPLATSWCVAGTIGLLARFLCHRVRMQVGLCGMLCPGKRARVAESLRKHVQPLLETWLMSVFVWHSAAPS